MDSTFSEFPGSASFQWPEPLVIDVISEHYWDVNPLDRSLIAKLQQHVLRAIFEGDTAFAVASRRELTSYGAAFRIAPERIARVDQAVFRELIGLAAIQLRTSSRRRAAVSSRLHVALGRLAPKADHVAMPVYVPSQPRRLLPAIAA